MDWDGAERRRVLLSKALLDAAGVFLCLCLRLRLCLCMQFVRPSSMLHVCVRVCAVCALCVRAHVRACVRVNVCACVRVPACLLM